MIKNLKKYIAVFAEIAAVLLAVGLYRAYKMVFAKRTLLFVTKQKIRSITIGPVVQLCLLLTFIWVGGIFMQSLEYDEIVSAKSDEINRLQAVNSYFEREFNDVNEKLSKVSEYLNSISGNKRAAKAQEQEVEQPDNINGKGLSKDDKRTLNQIRSVDNHLADIHSVVKMRIKKIENAIALTGLNIKKTNVVKNIGSGFPDDNTEVSLNDKKEKFRNQGGPALDDIMSSVAIDENSLEKHLKKVKFTGEVDYLITLENLINVMPFSKPMRNYYISSGFGYRVDPIHRRRTAHHGLDFVGVANERIISPSSGKVVLAGKFSDYGNAVVIDHGFGITTRYGHLREIKVKEGQAVKRGDVIATQGSTGRSTGPHLHYEVRYRNAPLNPRRFLEAGEYMFNEEASLNHVNS